MTVDVKRLDTTDQKSNAESRGKRLKSLRMMTGLSRKALDEKFNISASTIQSWEDAKAGGLTEKGARRVIMVFKKEGIRCSLDWLLYGIGYPPQLSNKLFDEGEEGEGESGRGAPAHASGEVANEDRAIINELLVFRQNNPDAVEYIISDDGMSPHYNPGDYVAGKRRTGKAIESVIGYDCVVETMENEILFRRLKPGNKPGTFNLVSTNLESTVKEPLMYNREILNAAPAIWHRRKDPSRN